MPRRPTRTYDGLPWLSKQGFRPGPPIALSSLECRCGLWPPSRLVAHSRPAFASWALRGPGRSWIRGSPVPGKASSPCVPLGAVSEGRCCACNEGSLGGKADEIKSRPPRPFPLLGRPALRLATSRRPRDRGDFRHHHVLVESEGVNDAFRRSPGSPSTRPPLPRPARHQPPSRPVPPGRRGGGANAEGRPVAS
ncbi:hypothetical protein CcrKarma_gp130 [Caulobacter virus Karma]|uniref:hypothetical protein n=1 Tax=Caulobacter virus Karma TaxID=1211641 RepID=UPI00028B8C04|nr:hypothetical protein CcrKarma_gp130 [Caulobacter virus Karma]AFU87647.1 hypothetical protein CcrKarma_gp130 [Caulobacter virus Karma]